MFLRTFLSNSKLKSFSIYLIIFIILCPIYINLDFSTGIHFDSYYFNRYGRPSIPISLILLFFIFLFNIKIFFNKKNKLLLLLIILISFFIIVNIFYNNQRALIVGVGILLPFISYSIVGKLFKKDKFIYNKLYLTLFFIIIVKLVFDMIMYNNIINLNEQNTSDVFLLIQHKVLQNHHFSIFSTPNFINPFFVIYNYFDYFPFIYFLAVILSLFNLLNKKLIKLSIILLLVSFVVILDTGSRLFIYSLYLLPILAIFYYITKYKLKYYYILFIIVSLILTMIIGLLDFKMSDVSLLSRYNLAHSYFNNFSFSQVLFPFLNEFRINLSGSLHNEMLEIFSYFGFVTVLYYTLLCKLFLNVNKEYQILSYFIMFVILIGALIQINLGNPYLGIIFGMVLGIFSIEVKGNSHELN